MERTDKKMFLEGKIERPTLSSVIKRRFDFSLELHRNPLAPKRFPERLHFETEFANANRM